MFNKAIHYFIASSLMMASASFAQELSVTEDGFVGQYYPHSSDIKRVGVLVLGGSEGGTPEKLAKSIVDAGFPTLALAYFKEDGLPQELERIPLEYMAQAKSWLLKQTNVKTDELIIVGWSKGAELALLLASKDEQVSRVVAIAPSSVAWAGILNDWTKVPASSWTEQGKDLAHVAFKPSGAVNGLRDLYAQSLSNRIDEGEADIPVEQIRAQVILMTGELDEIWPASEMADAICKRMNSVKEGQCEHFNYLDRGHLIDYAFLDDQDEIGQLFIQKLNSK